MDILKVYPKQLHISLDISEEELNHILNFLDACEVDYGGKGENLKKAGEFVSSVFFPRLNQLSEELKGMK